MQVVNEPEGNFWEIYCVKVDVELNSYISIGVCDMLAKVGPRCSRFPSSGSPLTFFQSS